MRGAARVVGANGAFGAISERAVLAVPRASPASDRHQANSGDYRWGKIPQPGCPTHHLEQDEGRLNPAHTRALGSERS